MSELTTLDSSAAAALLAAGATAAGPCPSDPAGIAAWERQVAERALGLARLVPAVAERMARIAGAKPVTGVILSVRDVSGRAVITTRPTMGGRETEDFRTPWLNEPAGAAMAALARALVGRHCRIGKRLEATRDGQKKVGMCEWIEDLGPDPEAAARPAPRPKAPVRRLVASPPAAGGPELVSDRERQRVLAMARQLSGDRRERFVEWMRANRVPPLVHPDLTADQALRTRAFLANLDAVAGAAA